MMSKLAKKLMVVIATIFCFQNVVTVEAALNPTNLEWENRIISEEEIIQFEIVKISNLEKLKQEPVALLSGKNYLFQIEPIWKLEKDGWSLLEAKASKEVEVEICQYREKTVLKIKTSESFLGKLELKLFLENEKGKKKEIVCPMVVELPPLVLEKGDF